MSKMLRIVVLMQANQTGPDPPMGIQLGFSVFKRTNPASLAAAPCKIGKQLQRSLSGASMFQKFRECNGTDVFRSY